MWSLEDLTKNSNQFSEFLSLHYINRYVEHKRCVLSDVNNYYLFF